MLKKPNLSNQPARNEDVRVDGEWLSMVIKSIIKSRGQINTILLFGIISKKQPKQVTFFHISINIIHLTLIGSNILELNAITLKKGKDQ
jgi:hypothetical protein